MLIEKTTNILDLAKIIINIIIWHNIFLNLIINIKKSIFISKLELLLNYVLNIK